MSKRYKARRRRRYFDTCQECGARGTVLCYLPEPPRCFVTRRHGRPSGWRTMDCSEVRDQMQERAPDERLCTTCAKRGGYCMVCGDFWGGIESFEFLHPGLCDHCYDDLIKGSAFDEDDCALWEMEEAGELF